MAILSTKAAANEILKMNALNAVATATAFAALSSSDDAEIYTASTGTYGILIPADVAKNRRVLVKIDNTATAGASVYIEPGTSKVSAPQGRTSLSLSASSSYYIVIETGKFAKLEGKYKGFVVLTGAANTVKASYVVLP